MQAVVITAYRAPEQVYRLAEYLSRKFLVYIHFDKKMDSKKINECHFEKLRDVHLYSLFNVNWGGESSLGNFVFVPGSSKKSQCLLCAYNFWRGLAL